MEIHKSSDVHKALESSVDYRVVCDDGGVGSFPVQLYGTINDKPFYFRYRSNCASMKIWEDESSRDADFLSPLARVNINDAIAENDDSAGDLTVDQMISLFWELVELLDQHGAFE